MSVSNLPGCHRCGAAAAFQWMRAATEAEAAEQRAEITRLQGRELTDAEVAERYGPLRTAVTGCAAHHLGDAPADADSGLELRALLHEADCEGHGACACSS